MPRSASDIERPEDARQPPHATQARRSPQTETDLRGGRGQVQLPVTRNVTSTCSAPDDRALRLREQFQEGSMSSSIVALNFALVG